MAAGRHGALLLCLLSGVAAATPGFPGSDVTVPEDDAAVLMALDGGAASARIQRLRARLEDNPQDLQTATTLARAYLQRASRQGDPRYAGWARATLAPWWNETSPPAPVLILRARFNQHRHHFEAALNDLDAALAQSPQQPSAWLLKAAIQRLRGDLDAAAESCRRLAAVSSDPKIGLLCHADIAMLTDGARPTADRLEALLAGGTALAPWQADWARLLAAEARRMLGEPRKALKALGDRAGTTYRLGLRADMLLELGRADEVIPLLRDHLGVSALLLRYTLALKQVGDPAWRKARAKLVAVFAAADRRNDGVRHWRERAHLALAVDANPARALKLAQRNWQLQRDLADARLYALSAAAADRPAAAEPVRAWRQRYGVEDAVLSRALNATATPPTATR